MVNFEAEQTVAVPASEIVKILILQRRDNALNSIIGYKRALASGSSGNISRVSEDVLALFLEIQSALKRKYKGKEEEYEKLKSFSHSLKFSELYESFQLINDELDKWGLTRIDNRVNYDTRRAIEENERIDI